MRMLAVCYFAGSTSRFYQLIVNLHELNRQAQTGQVAHQASLKKSPRLFRKVLGPLRSHPPRHLQLPRDKHKVGALQFRLKLGKHQYQHCIKSPRHQQPRLYRESRDVSGPPFHLRPQLPVKFLRLKQVNRRRDNLRSS